MLDLTIIIVNWNTRELLRRCLESVFGTVHGLLFEVWVIDNGSTDGSGEMVRAEFPQVRLIENIDNLGFAKANNQALKVCSERYALLLNSDAFLMDGAVEGLIAALENDAHAGIAGARLEYPDGRGQRSYGSLPSPIGEMWSLLGLDKRREQKLCAEGTETVRPVEAVNGACMLVSRELLNEIGLFDERFFMFSEEIDLCKRAQAAGWLVVYAPGARAVHVGGGSSGLTAGRVLRLYTAKLQYIEKHHGQCQGRALLMMMWLTSTLKSFIYLPWDGKRAAFWREVSRGL